MHERAARQIDDVMIDDVMIPGLNDS